MKRKHFQELARFRFKDAQALAQAGCWDGAYYVAGYTVECALKACIARGTERFEFPSRKTVNSAYTHNLGDLLKVAKLDDALREAAAGRAKLAANWTLVAEWSEETRYERRSQADATILLRAIQDRKNGILSWLKKHW